MWGIFNSSVVFYLTAEACLLTLLSYISIVDGTDAATSSQCSKNEKRIVGIGGFMDNLKDKN